MQHFYGAVRMLLFPPQGSSCTQKNGLCVVSVREGGFITRFGVLRFVSQSDRGALEAARGDRGALEATEEP